MTGRRLWLAWVAASTLGVALGEPTAVLLDWAFASLFGQVTGYPAAILGFSITGGAFVAPQWLILRRLMPRAIWWIPLTAVGFVLGAMVGYPVGMSVAFTFPMWVVTIGRMAMGSLVVIAAIPAGMVTGAVQLGVLSKLAGRSSDKLLWMVASGIGASLFWLGFIAALSLELAPSSSLQSAPFTQPWIAARLAGALIGGGGYGAVTGLALAHFVKKTRREAQRLSPPSP